MSRLPSRPSGNPQPNDPKSNSPAPTLGAGEDVVQDQSVAPRLAVPNELPPIASRYLPPAPPEITAYDSAVQPPVSDSKPSARVPVVVAPTSAPSPVESVSEAPTDIPEAPQPAPLQNTAPSIETMHENKAETQRILLEEQDKRALAINSMSHELKKSVDRLFEHITDDTSSEVTINGPKGVGFKRGGQRFTDNDIDFGSVENYHAVINSFLLPLTNTNDRIGTVPHLIEGQLTVPDFDNPTRPPMIARLHIVAPPTVEASVITIAKKARNELSIDAMVNSGTMTTDMAKDLKSFARGRATIIFSGVSGAGKTTLLEAMSREFDYSDRIILIEDTPELKLPSNDLVVLQSHQARPGDDPNKAVTLEWLVRQANRMRPDRIVVGEVRGPEMAEFLSAANSGADGSMTTIHANTPQEAIQKMMSYAMTRDGVKSELSLLRDIASTVQIIVQMSNIDGRHIVSQIEEVSNTVNKATMGIQTSTIWKYDRNSGRFIFENRMSDSFQEFLKQRGVEPSLPTNFNQRY